MQNVPHRVAEDHLRRFYATHLYDLVIPDNLDAYHRQDSHVPRSAANRGQIVNWADLSYDYSTFYCGSLKFGTGNYGAFTFTVLGSVPLSGSSFRDFYFYVADVTSPMSKSKWLLIAAGRRILGDMTTPIDVVKLDVARKTLQFIDESGRAFASAHIPKATDFARTVGHL